MTRLAKRRSKIRTLAFRRLRHKRLLMFSMNAKTVRDRTMLRLIAIDLASGRLAGLYCRQVDMLTSILGDEQALWVLERVGRRMQGSTFTVNRRLKEATS